uniref:Uncharacterized protein n=1 Tax=Romanomermis culicivorax TaxID=13658 RepID=A0A915I3I0_ROMCU
MPPAAAVQSVQSTPAASQGYISDIARDFPKLTADGMGKFPDFEHRIMLMDDAIPIAGLNAIHYNGSAICTSSCKEP